MTSFYSAATANKQYFISTISFIHFPTLSVNPPETVSKRNSPQQNRRKYTFHNNVKIKPYQRIIEYKVPPKSDFKTA